MRSHLTHALLGAILALSAVSFAPAHANSSDGPAAQPRYQTLSLGKGDIEYALILPENFDPQKTYPAVLALPPGAQNRDMVEAGLSRYWEAAATERGWIVVSPINPAGAQLFRATTDPLGKLTGHIKERFNIEGGTFHLTGVSNGGRAAFLEALEHPERYASLTVLPGLLPEDATPARIKRLAELPISMYVGGADTSWVKEAERSVDTLKSNGVPASLTILEGEGHVVSVTPDTLYDLLDTFRPTSHLNE